VPGAFSVPPPETQLQHLWEPSSFNRPSALTVNKRGDVALLLRKTEFAVGETVLEIGRDGRGMLVDRPSDHIIHSAAQFFSYLAGANGQPTYPYAKVQNFVQSSDGTAFMTVSAQFSGGYSGDSEATFEYDKTSWRPLSVASSSIGNKNNWIAAADGRRNLALVLNSLIEPPSNVNPDAHQPQFNNNVICRFVNGRALPLGSGIATAIVGDYVAGYNISYGLLGDQPREKATTIALEYIGKRKINLGSGIAWSVNSSNVVVGDDRHTIDGHGRPTLWAHGREISLSSTPGSAYAISDDGTVVGDVATGAFISRFRDNRVKTILLDRLLADRSWHVIHAYGLSSNRSIVAVASRRGGSAELVRLSAIDSPSVSAARKL